MLKMIRLDIEKHYYDPSFRGIDLHERFDQADERIKNAKSNSEIFGVIAQVLLDFDDSHLFFIPPPRVAKVEYGWQMQAIGDKCYVVAVKPGSDAEAKGLKPGDLILSIDGFTPTREVGVEDSLLLLHQRLRYFRASSNLKSAALFWAIVRRAPSCKAGSTDTKSG